MRIAIVHDRIAAAAAPDVADVLVQAAAIDQALVRLGHTTVCLGCDLDLTKIRRRLEAAGAEMVVNLMESIEGHGRLIHLVPFLLDVLGLPYTGVGAEAMLLTSNKLLAKEWLAAAGIPTPPWVTADQVRLTDPLPTTWIIKSVWEHASIGLGEHSLVGSTDPAIVQEMLPARAGALGGVCFAEGFVAGREFNLSLLAGAAGPQVLPPAEIIFEGFSEVQPKIVDYRAKWEEDSYAYQHTPRCFDFAADDQPLLQSLTDLARRCWECFGLAGYARVDFRVDAEGHPWVLEVNANPCLSPDAGFAAALERAGIAFDEAVGRLVADAERRFMKAAGGVKM
ncbi:MAG: ATP-grasp domain-containing protein [Deltaproteobacteria bacterium]|nr:ATP-grasp domain-containing protein [Candidatus Anaeroferrophillacea bacterium]